LAGLEFRDWQFPYIDYALYDILPNDPIEVAAIKRKPPNSITMRSQEHCITDHMMDPPPLLVT